MSSGECCTFALSLTATVGACRAARYSRSSASSWCTVVASTGCSSGCARCPTLQTRWSCATVWFGPRCVPFSAVPVRGSSRLQGVWHCTIEGPTSGSSAASGRTRKVANRALGRSRAQSQGAPILCVQYCMDAHAVQVSVSIIEKVGGFEACAALYAQFMADALSLPRGMRFAREPDADPARESAMHKLEMHASREALSLSITPLCSRVRTECHRFNKDPVRLPLSRFHRSWAHRGW